MKINLTIGAKYITVEYLKDDETTSLGFEYFIYPIYRLRADGVSWWFDRTFEGEYNFPVYFANIVNYNGSPIGATAYATITAAILAAVTA